MVASRRWAAFDYCDHRLCDLERLRSRFVASPSLDWIRRGLSDPSAEAVKDSVAAYLPGSDRLSRRRGIAGIDTKRVGEAFERAMSVVEVA